MNDQPQSPLLNSISQDRKIASPSVADQLVQKLGINDPDEYLKQAGVAGQAEEDPAPKIQEAMKADGLLEMAGKGLKQAVGGVLDAGQETLNANKAISLPMQYTLKAWNALEGWAQEKGLLESDLIPNDDENFDIADKIIPKEDQVGYQVVRSTAQFLAPYGALSKAAKGIKVTGKLGTVVKGAVMGGAVDFAAFDPHEKRLSNLAQDLGLENPIAEYLAADPKDGEIEGRFKNVVEGALLGMGVEGAVKVAGMIVDGVKGYRVKRINEAQGKLADPDVGNVVKVDPPKPGVKASEVINGKPAEAPKEVAGATKGEPAPNFQKATQEEADTFLTRVGKEGSEKIEVDLPQIPEDTDILKVIKESTELDSVKANREMINPGPISDAERKMFADSLGMSLDEFVNKSPLQGLNSFEMEKAKKLMIGASKDLSDKAKAAYGPGASLESRAAFKLALDRFSMISAQFRGARAEWGRAGRALHKGTTSEEGYATYLNELVQLAGGPDQLEKLARALDLTLAGGRDDLAKMKALSKWIQQTPGQRLKTAGMSLYYNHLLNTGTHVWNALDNGLSLLVRPFDRAVAGGVNALRGEGTVQLGESAAMVSGYAKAFGESWMAAFKAFKDGQSSDTFSKGLEIPFDPLSYQNVFGRKPENAFEHGMNYLGKFLAMNSRGLVAADEFFKTMVHRSELHAQALREGVAQGFTGKKLKDFTREYLDNPPTEGLETAVTEARRMTYTDAITPDQRPLSAWIMNGLEKIPAGKLFFPFMRTGLNIAASASERIPVVAQLTARYQADLAAGGARAEMARARVGIGMAGAAAVVPLTLNGALTGSGPANKDARRQLEATGWKPYSIKIGDTYHSYRRLGWMGAYLGLIADTTELAAHDVHGENGVDLGVLALSGIARITDFVTPEMLVENVGTMMEAISEPEKAGKQWASRMAANVVMAPEGSLNLRDYRRREDPLNRQTWGDTEGFNTLWDQTILEIKNQIPGLSQNLPERLDFWGNAQKYTEGGVIANEMGFRSFAESKDPVDKEIYRLKLLRAPMDEVLPGEEDLTLRLPTADFAFKGAKTKLSPFERNELIKLMAGHGLPGAKPLKDVIRDVIKKDYPMIPARLRHVDQHKRDVIRAIVGDYRKAAKEHFLKTHPEVQRRLKVFDQRAKMLLSGGALPLSEEDEE